MKVTLEAVKEAGLPAIVVYPNADAGGRSMIEVIERYRNDPSFSIHVNLERETFISLMQHVSMMIGNSSSGIIETASFGLPVVNFSSRQEGRERAKNVVDVYHNKDAIKEAINKVLAQPRQAYNNPYGDGKTAERIVRLLSSIEIDKN